ncbi:MAG: endonuclease/exonuclease/phosphatase family protein, partial [Candidatus Saccharimonadales bacterium]
MTFSILFWNIWYHNQVKGGARFNRLKHELKRLVDQHQPDFIALNEVVRASDDQAAPVVAYLQKLGYKYNYCANMAKLDDYWMSGAALCSRFNIDQKQRIVISKNGYAAKHGHPGFNKEAISVRATLPKGQELKIIVAHPLATVDSLKDHKVGMKSLDKIAHSETYTQNTILIGDMNEWRLIPGALRRKVSDVMHSRTGSVLHPTWRHNAYRFTPLRLNLDYMYWSKGSSFSLKDFKVLASNV